MRDLGSALLLWALALACGADPATPASGDELAELEMRPAALVDRTHGGMPAASFLVPADWQAGGEVVWDYAQTQLPYQAQAFAHSPDGRVWVQAFPTLGFYWLQPPTSQVPRGGRNLGLVHLPAMEPAEALMRFVIEPARADRAGLQVVGMRQIPQLSESLGQGPSPGSGLAIRVRYEQDGVVMNEEFLANYVRTTGQALGIVQHNWYLDLVHSMAAPEEEFAKWRPLLTGIAVSFEADPQWLAFANEVSGRLRAAFEAQIAQGLAQIQAARAASQMIARTYDEIRAMNRESFEYRNRVMDHTTQQFSDMIRGVERMQDPLWGQSEQPYEFDYHWTDGNGNYRHSNDPTYDPNLQPGPSWSRMQRSP